MGLGMEVVNARVDLSWITRAAAAAATAGQASGRESVSRLEKLGNF